MLGAGRVIAIDCVPERLEMARAAGAETLDFSKVDVLEALRDMTGNQGPDACMDVVGMEASGHGVVFMMDRAKQMMRTQMDRPSFFVRQSSPAKRAELYLFRASTPASSIRCPWVHT